MKTLVCSLVLASIAVAGAPAARADNTCSPDVTVTYQGGHGTSIKVVAVEYSVNGGGTWHRENVTNSVLTTGKAKTFRSQRLGSASKGLKLTLRAVYQPDTGRGYGSDARGDIKASTTACENNVTYGVVVN